MSEEYTKKIIFIIFLCALTVLVYRNSHSDEACDDYTPVFSDEAVDNPPAATSYLIDRKNPSRYAPACAFDNRLETSWVEGKQGDGIGEKIAFQFNAIKSVSIFPGFGKERYFTLNNRLKKASFKVYKIKDVLPHQCATTFRFGELVAHETLHFRDSMTMQTFHIRKREDERGFIGVLEILEVYRGSRWQDTCIAEITVDD
jgi:hypothetical protein